MGCENSFKSGLQSVESRCEVKTDGKLGVGRLRAWRLEPAGAGGGGARCALAALPQSSAGTCLEKHSATTFHIKSSWPSYTALECAVKVFVRVT